MDMPGELYRNLIDHIDHHGVEGIWLFNIGEPLLHPEFKENLRHVSSKKNLGVIWLSTNGRYLTEDTIRLILQSNIDYLNFSAHAVTEETYNTIIPPGHFHIVQSHLEKFYELKGNHNLPRKPYLHCQMIEQETTKHEIDAFIAKHYQRAEVVSINLLEYLEIPNNVFAFRQRERTPLTSCNRVTRNDCFIFSNGDVTLCDTAYNAELYLGNIHQQTLNEIWNGENRKMILHLNEQKKMAELEFCKKCLDYDL
jgi:radical SAM protein with 4Fe4S-binding SPASM domain